MRFDAEFPKMCIIKKLKLLIELVGEEESHSFNGEYLNAQYKKGILYTLYSIYI